MLLGLMCQQRLSYSVSQSVSQSFCYRCIYIFFLGTQAGRILLQTDWFQQRVEFFDLASQAGRICCVICYKTRVLFSCTKNKNVIHQHTCRSVCIGKNCAFCLEYRNLGHSFFQYRLPAR